MLKFKMYYVAWVFVSFLIIQMAAGVLWFTSQLWMIVMKEAITALKLSFAFKDFLLSEGRKRWWGK